MILAFSVGITMATIRRFRAFGAGRRAKGRASPVGRGLVIISTEMLGATSPLANSFHWTVALRMH